MKISASIYSDKKRELKAVITDLVDHQVDLLHVDCNDDLSVFEDIKIIRQLCDLPIDLHVITDEPEKYFELLKKNPVEYLTFQYEQLTEKLVIPEGISGRKGLAIVTPTPVAVFREYESFDFILIMATVPGQSGGKFDEVNFAKIREFRTAYPSKSIHVDGGVNPEVSFILRNMGVTSAVSGSYLFNAASVGNALMNLTKRTVDSHYLVRDFMIPLEEAPVLYSDELSLEGVLREIENGKLGFTLVIEKSGKLQGIISNADVRRGLLNNLEQLDRIKVESFVNTDPQCISEDASVLEMLQLIKQSKFPVSYLPVLNKDAFAVGIVTFVNLIKGEL